MAKKIHEILHHYTHIEANSATVPTVLPSCEWK